jgi:hypothetical protein
MAVWLAADDYDLVAKRNTISATSMLKPAKSLILEHRIQVANTEKDTDLLELIASRMGTAIHTAAEKAWTDHLDQALSAMGWPKKGRDMIRVNPPLPVDPEYHNVFIEQRSEKELEGITISGKYDFVENGRVKDIKSTSVYTWIFGSKDSDYAWQGSIYRWLNPEIITDDFVDIEFLFKDWKHNEYLRDKQNYPMHPVMTKSYPLKPLAETEHFLRTKIKMLKQYGKVPQNKMPACTPKELWQKPTKYAYFKNPQKKARATKVYSSHQEAMDRMILDRSVGCIDPRPGIVKFCMFCPGRPICKQAKLLEEQKLLEP